MPNNLRIVMIGGMVIAVAAGMISGIHAGLFVALGTALAGILWLLLCAFVNCPKSFRWHFFAALTWTLIAGSATVSCLSGPSTNDAITKCYLLVAGLVWIASWQQLRERVQGREVVQKRRPLFARLLVQTLWGPLALCMAINSVIPYVQTRFEKAVANRDLPTAFFMRDCGLGSVDTYEMKAGLSRAVIAEDMDGVSAYLAVGTRGWAYGVDRTERLDSSRVIELYLHYGYSPDNGWGDGEQPLHDAVGAENIKLIRTLLRHGADRNIKNRNGETPLQVARQLENKEIIALLTQPTKSQGQSK